MNRLHPTTFSRLYFYAFQSVLTKQTLRIPDSDQACWHTLRHEHGWLVEGRDIMMTGLGMAGLLMAWYAGNGYWSSCGMRAAASWLACVYYSRSAVCLDMGNAMK